MCFIGHGAFGIITKPIWCNYFGVFGIGQDLAYRLMPLVGGIDILLGLALLFYPIRAVAAWLVVWGFITASLRPFSGEPFAEMIERAGNYGAPLALLLLSAATSRTAAGIPTGAGAGMGAGSPMKAGASTGTGSPAGAAGKQGMALDAAGPGSSAGCAPLPPGPSCAADRRLFALAGTWLAQPPRKKRSSLPISIARVHESRSGCSHRGLLRIGGGTGGPCAAGTPPTDRLLCMEDGNRAVLSPLGTLRVGRARRQLWLYPCLMDSTGRTPGANFLANPNQSCYLISTAASISG